MPQGECAARPGTGGLGSLQPGRLAARFCRRSRPLSAPSVSRADRSANVRIEAAAVPATRTAKVDIDKLLSDLGIRILGRGWYPTRRAEPA